MQPSSSERRAAIVQADKRHVWHPYTPMRAYIDEVDPLVIERAVGSRLYDVDGKSYIDANSSWWVAALGHRHPRLIAVLTEQAEALCHAPLAGATHEAAALLAAELASVAPPGLGRVFYSDDGSTAVEAALKIAVQYWKLRGETKRRFVALDGAFHGETLGAASLGGVDVFRRAFAGLLVDCVHVPPPHDDDDDDAHRRAFEALERALEERDVAALVLEPRVQAASGMRIYHERFLERARAACDAYGALLVHDEVFTGYGRTGPMWAGTAGRPDLMCIAKGFTSGILPMAATLVSEHVFEEFLGGPERTFYHGHSYCGHPLGAAVAREVLAIYRDERILERAVPKARLIADAFRSIGRIRGVERARSLGMTAAVDLAPVASYLGQAGWRAYAAARERGAYLRPLGDTVYITPPLTIEDNDLTELLDIVHGSVETAVG